MRHARISVRVPALCALLFCAALAGPQLAPAATRTHASGTITVLDNVVKSTSTVGGVTIAHAVAHVRFAGTLQGRATERYTSLTFPDKSVVLFGRGAFRGKIAGTRHRLRYTFDGNAANGVIFIRRGGHGVRGTLPYALNSSTGAYAYSGRLRLP